MQENDNTLFDNGTVPVITVATPLHTEDAPTDAAPSIFRAKPLIKYAALAGAGIGIGLLTMGFTADDSAEPVPPENAAAPDAAADAAATTTDAATADALAPTKPDTTAEKQVNHLAQTNPPTILEHADLATTVTDEMTFSQAFHAARAEQGAGGVFEHHGQYYNTFYKAEWANMSPDQKAEYAHSIDHLAEPQHFQTLPAAVVAHAHEADTHVHATIDTHHDTHHEPVIVEQHTHSVTINASDTSHVSVATAEHADSSIIINTHDHATADVTIAADHDHAAVVATMEPAHDNTHLTDYDAAHAVAHEVAIEPVHINTQMPDMPEGLVEIPLEEGVTGFVHLNTDGQPDAIYIDQDHNHVPEVVIQPDTHDPAHATFLLDENQDHIIDSQGALNDDTHLTHDTYNNHQIDTYDDHHTATYDEPTIHHDEPTIHHDEPIADFDNNADVNDWG